MNFKSDSQRRAMFATMGVFSKRPDYSQDTWQKNVAGVSKFKIDEYYRGQWDKLGPQFKDRNILVRYAYDHKPVVKRHSHGGAYTTISSVDQLSEQVREHGVEFWPETAKKGDLERADMAVLDIDNMGGASEKDIKGVTKGAYKYMKGAFDGSPYIISTHGGYHVGVKLDKPMAYKTLRKTTDREVIGPLEGDFNGLVSRHRDGASVFLDKTPMKVHGSTKAIGSLNMPDLSITEKVSIDDIDGFRRKKLK